MTQDEFVPWFIEDVMSRIYKGVWSVEQSQRYDLRIVHVEYNDGGYEYSVGRDRSYGFGMICVGADYKLRYAVLTANIEHITNFSNITFETYRDYCNLTGEDETLARLKW